MKEYSVFTDVLRHELEKYHSKEKVSLIMKKWNRFIGFFYTTDRRCLSGLKQFWYKIPTIVRDMNYFNDRVVFDVGSMCGLTSFLMLEAGNAKKVYAIDYKKHWCSCGEKAFLEIGYDSKKIKFLHLSINEALTAQKLITQEKNLLYLSDMLYQIEKSPRDLAFLRNKLKNFNLILCHSRELNTKFANRDHFDSLGHYENIYKFLDEENTKTFFPHNIGRLSVDHTLRRSVPYPESNNVEDYSQYSFNSYITVIRENNESSN